MYQTDRHRQQVSRTAITVPPSIGPTMILTVQKVAIVSSFNQGCMGKLLKLPLIEVCLFEVVDAVGSQPMSIDDNGIG